MRKTSGDPFDLILAALNAAALDKERWPKADRLIGEINGMRGSALALFDGRSRVDGTPFLMRICLDGQRRRDWERRYFEDYYAEDERIPHFARREPGHITPTGDLFTDAEKKLSPTYNELLVATKAQAGLNMRIESQPGPPVIWIACDPVERRGWSHDQVRLLERLQPHVHQFALVSHALAEAEVRGTATAQLLASPRLGVIHLDRRGRIAEANDRALEILRQGDSLTDRDGFLQTGKLEEDIELSRLLARALPPFKGQGSAGSMRVTRLSSLKQLALHITPVGDDYPHFRTRRFAAIVLVLDPTSRTWVDPAQLEILLGLTPVESRLAVALAAGRTPFDIARESGRAEDTVRWHVKQIYGKLGISRQVDLVRQVLSLEGFDDESGDR